MEVIEAQALAGCANIVYAPSEGLGDAFQLLAGRDLAFSTVIPDVLSDGGRDMELVRVWVGGLGLLKLEDMP